jgi:hypothetical protein
MVSLGIEDYKIILDELFIKINSLTSNFTVDQLDNVFYQIEKTV